MTQSKATRSIIDTHRHIFGPKLRQKFIENIGFDDSKPLPQANADEMFFYRESVDVDYSMEIQQQSGVTLCVNSYGGEIDTFAKSIIKASTIDTLKFLHDESFELRDPGSPTTLPAWPTLMLWRRIRAMSLIRCSPAKKLAASAFRAAMGPVRIRSFSTRPRPNGYGSTHRTRMFSFIFIPPWYRSALPQCSSTGLMKPWAGRLIRRCRQPA